MIPHRHIVHDPNILKRCLLSFFFPFSKKFSHIQINSTCIRPPIKFTHHNNPVAKILCTFPSYSHPPKNIAVHDEKADSGSTNYNPGFIVTEAIQFVLLESCEACAPLTFLMFASIQEDKMLPSSAVSPTASQNLGAWYNASIINCYESFTTQADICALEFSTAFHINRFCWNAKEMPAYTSFWKCPGKYLYSLFKEGHKLKMHWPARLLFACLIWENSIEFQVVS